jgi:protein tyrosine phosphatase
MIIIQKSQTADTRSCDFSQVTKVQLLKSSAQHIGDVRKGMDFIKELIDLSATLHDHDKLTGLDEFHADFITGFKQTGWWDNHRKVNRHHLLQDDGIPTNVNLVDVLDMIVDCVMAGMGRTGTVYPLEIKPEVLMTAFQNTVDLLKSQIIVEGE